MSVLLLPVWRAPLQAHGDLHEQIEALSERIAQRPNDPSLLIQRADLFRLHQQWAQALEDLDRADRAADKPAGADLVRGRVFLDSVRFHDARAALDRFLQHRPRHVEALLVRARVLMRLDEAAAAAADLSRAIAHSSRPEPEHYTAHAEALRSTDPPRWEEALRSLDDGMKKLGPIVSLQLAAVDLEVALGRFDAALARLEEAAHRVSRQESWLVRRAEILQRANRPVEARQAYAAALQAIEALPVRLRHTRATQRLEAAARDALKSAASAEEESKPQEPNTRETIDH